MPLKPSIQGDILSHPRKREFALPAIIFMPSIYSGDPDNKAG